ncbi:hypothetical protein LPTSP3_g06410 [Leptospira kobayashii]|uniref:PAS domain-containing protein n=1 Tax=Leptospira kobayashii TaxID=1917830 RepID=A0ABM7UGH9_9LEPT|nr:SpoIIE family protein phosphatase [Leptospira kobayashii]BDA77711.1 hypothetical protein LPTSP3_g06410 [Leptospira kobayashii]
MIDENSQILEAFRIYQLPPNSPIPELEEILSFFADTMQKELAFISWVSEEEVHFAHSFDIKNGSLSSLIPLVLKVKDKPEELTIVTEVFSDLPDMANPCYIGYPIITKLGIPIGVLSVLSDSLIEDAIRTKETFRFFAQRIMTVLELRAKVKTLLQKDYQILNQYVEMDDLYNNSPCGYLTVNHQGLILKSNVTFLDWLKYSKREMVGKLLFQDVLSEENKIIFEKFLRNLIEGNNLNDQELDISKRNGDRITCLVSGRKIFLPTENQTIFRLSVFDITEKSKIQNALELESNKVKSKNKTLSNQLAMAAKVQKKLLPSSNPNESISFAYKPLDEVGGDFCDFIKFPNPNQFGIFISDVAGHGVPSAFITAIMKSTIQQASPELKENPSEFLEFVNDSIMDYIDNRFVTAMYSLFDLENRTVRYSSAGHPMPFKIYKNTIELFPLKKGSFPLGVQSSSVRKSKGKGYVSFDAKFEKGTRILFYTDGLTEAKSGRHVNQEVYFEAVLPEILEEYSKYKLDVFLNSILSELAQFIGKKDPEDDVCLVAIDL